MLTDILLKASDDTNIKLTSLPSLLSFSYAHETNTYIAITSAFISAQENVELKVRKTNTENRTI